MRDVTITLPELALIGATRAALGAGIAFLLADRLSRNRRISIGWTLAAIGALSTIPLAFEVLGRGRTPAHDQLSNPSEAGYSQTALGTWRPPKAFVW
jgi:hypothetical protein